MQISAGSLHLDATLEAPIVATVGGVLDLQVVDAVAGPEINSAEENGNEGKGKNSTRCKLTTMSISQTRGGGKVRAGKRAVVRWPTFACRMEYCKYFYRLPLWR